MARADALAKTLGSKDKAMLQATSLFSRPLQTITGCLTQPAVSRALGLDVLEHGPSGEPPWDIMETFTFESTAKLQEALRIANSSAELPLVPSGMKTQYFPARCIRVAGEAPKTEELGLACTLKARPTMSREQMHQVWESDHANLVLRLSDVIGFSSYFQAHKLPIQYMIPSATPCQADGIAFLQYSGWTSFLIKSLNPAGLLARVPLVHQVTSFIHLPSLTPTLGQWQ
eukprot:TRINITY_DN80884_c0_g1_i1.p1 TRINITY_DN80884_c0_g1~~TRINITY_DN80884_c0_g1_i1.p1  ORF type:complete len:229 (-),score=21.86 TRINITY_DN80884_c0_g1_i1:93-779(-)